MAEKKIIPHSKPSLDTRDEKAVLDVLESNHLESGKNVEKLEEYFRQDYDSKYALAVSTGFAAIHLSLIALGIDSGDEVILPSYACSALLNPVLLLGAKPQIVDIDENSFNVSANEIEKHINKNTKAIIVPHIYGFPAKIDEIKSFGIPIIEDCAQSIGGKYKSKKLGSYGELSVFSFYASKMITSGDGGMIITDNENYSEIINNYRYYGHKKLHKYLAYNYHLTNLPAALAASQLKRLDDFIARRKEIAGLYNEYFNNVPGIFTNFENKTESCYYRYPVQLDADIEEVKNKMLKAGIRCGYGVLDGMHQLQDLPGSDFPNTEHLLSSILSLPIYPLLDNKGVSYIAESLINILKIQ